MSKATVLVVDDEEYNRDIITEYLEDEDYDFDTAEDGLVAWNKLEADPEKFDAVILDRMMPNMNGMEVLQKIKGNLALESIPVIFQTALAAKEEIAEGIAAGAYYYLTKPFEEEMLLSVLATAIEDRNRYKRMQEASDEAIRGFKLLTEGQFEFRSAAAARELASSVSNIFPDHRRVVVGLTELLLNAVEHGNLAITYNEKSELKEADRWEDEVELRLNDPQYKDRRVRVSFNKYEDRIVMNIKDEGSGFDWEQYLIMAPERASDSHGRGIAMANMMSFDHLEYKGCGNEVEVTVNI